MTQASEYAWHNGKIGPREVGAPSVASISFHLGTGVFDGLMAYWNEDHYYLHRAEEHFVRFKTGAERMGMNIPWTVEQLIRGAQMLLTREERGDQYVRPIVYRGAPELWVTGSEGLPVDVSIFTVRVNREINRPIRCHLSPVERISSRSIPGHTKVSGAYVNSFNARRCAERAGFQDGIMLDRQGRITEASAANIFFIEADGICTPPLNPDVFPGITRKVVLEIAAACRIPHRECDLWPHSLQSIQGAFLCSTLMEIRGIAQLGEAHLRTFEHPIYLQIVREFEQLVRERSVNRSFVSECLAQSSYERG
jgi:branched-chain amino acid aminotransferase